jgi:EAL domain-containing protein (putative c-di-GMP-specific phosphodiesterase class I)
MKAPHTQTVPADTLLFRQGEVGDCAYLIESGTVEIFQDGAQGRHLAFLRSGDIFGEMALVGDPIRTASARIIEDSVLMLIDLSYLQERLLRADPMIRHLLRTVIGRCRDLLLQDDPNRPPPLVFNLDRQAALARLRIEHELRSALEYEEFLLYFQPLINLQDRSVYGFEGLIRWNHPERGVVSPIDFMSCVEESDIAHRLCYWSVRKAAEALQALRVDYPDHTWSVAINLSGPQVGDKVLLSLIQQSLLDYGLPQGSLKLEITETLLVSEIESAAAFLQECRRLGIPTAIDDFGTGYSSLAYLHQFPVDFIKIDQSFLRNIADNPATQTILAATARLGKALGLGVIVEGVESLEAAELVSQHGCDIGQGYVWGKPMSWMDLQTWLSDGCLSPRLRQTSLE